MKDEKFGWFLFILDVFLFPIGGLVEKENRTLGLIILILACLLLLILWRMDRR